MKQVRRSAIAIATLACAATFSFGWSEQGSISLSVESAQARVGRPGTPVSVAGVARRQTRRAYGYGAAAVGAAAVGTAAAVAATNYYGGPGYYSGGPYYQNYPSTGYYGGGPYARYNGYPPQDYGARNGFRCQPGTMVRLDDGRVYPCQ